MEGEDVVKARVNGVNLTVTFMDFPLTNVDPPVQTDHQAHIIVLADGDGDLAAVRDQAMKSLQKQEAVVGTYV